MAVQHFLTLLDLPRETLLKLMQRGMELKRMQRDGVIHEPLRNRVLTMVFEKSSTRTRVSFEAGMAQLGGHAIFLSPRDTQLGRGEPVADTARVLSGMTDAIMVRTFGHDVLEEFAKHASVPVINGLSDLYHPCQLLADMQTYFEHRGDIRGKTVTWLGDGNNMCHSYINAARQFDFQLRIGCPDSYRPQQDIVDAAGDRILVTNDPQEAARDADLIVTDVWASMGQEDDKDARHSQMAPYQVNASIMSVAREDALFMHCLPAHRGEEVTAEVIDGPQSVVWDEAHNRLHAQKALLEYLLVGE